MHTCITDIIKYAGSIVHEILVNNQLITVSISDIRYVNNSNISDAEDNNVKIISQQQYRHNRSCEAPDPLGVTQNTKQINEETNR